MVACYTCGSVDYWNKLHAGHFMHGKLDYNPVNVNPQCVRCNKWLHGNLGNYANQLIKDYGVNVIDKLKEEARLEPKYSRSDLEDMCKKFESEICDLMYKNAKENQK